MDLEVGIIISADGGKCKKALRSFLEKTTQQFKFPELDEGNRREELWQAINNILKTSRDKAVIADCFAVIRVVSRDKTDLNTLITDELLGLIKTHSGLDNADILGDKENEAIAIEAFKCLCNILFNCHSSVLACVNNGILEGIMNRVKLYSDKKQISSEIKYFDMKVLFLITALNADIRHRLKDELRGFKYLTKTLELILKEYSHDENPILNDRDVEIVCEICKTLFNLTILHRSSEAEDARCNKLVKLLREYMILPTKSKEKRNELHNHIINLLINMPSRCLKTMAKPVDKKEKIDDDLQYEGHDMRAVHEALLFLKNKFSAEPTVSRQHELLSPVLTLLLKSAINNREIRKYLRLQILPPLRDVRTRPEEGNTIRNSLCRLLTSPITQVKDLAAELLFVLCKQNVGRMIKYTGYGNAAGLFANRGLLGGRTCHEAALYSSDSDSDTEEYKELKDQINPVKGCYEPPHPNATENMTEEQKEYEAMKLVELMDNMIKKDGIKPCRIGADGRPEAIEHVLQLQESIKMSRQAGSNSDSD